MTPLVAANLKRINKNGVLGSVALRLPELRLTALGCLWLRDGDGERIALPSREWLAPGGGARRSEIFIFDDGAAQHEFEHTALAALHRLIKAAAR